MKDRISESADELLGLCGLDPADPLLREAFFRGVLFGEHSLRRGEESVRRLKASAGDQAGGDVQGEAGELIGEELIVRDDGAFR